MVIQHNISALNAGYQLGKAAKEQAGSAEKLSTGYRINRAADDSAGLAISEKMRFQIRGLDRAQRNIQDGISVTHIADAALNETHAMLQRMRELAVQAADDVNSDEDRQSIQEEINQLADQVDAIAYQTNFNEAVYPLLGGADVGDGLIPDPTYSSVLDRYAFIKDPVTGQATGGIGMYIPGMHSYAGSIGGYGNNGHALISLTLADGTKTPPISMFQSPTTNGTVTINRTVTDDKMIFEYEDTSNGVHFMVDITCSIVDEKDVAAMRGGQYFLSSFEITNLGAYIQDMDIMLHTDPINGYMMGSPTLNGTNMGNTSHGEKIVPGQNYDFICNPGSYSAYTNCDVTARLTSSHIPNPPDVAYGGSGIDQTNNVANMNMMQGIYDGTYNPSNYCSDFHFASAWLDRTLNTGASFTASTMFGLSYPLTMIGGGTHTSGSKLWIQSGYHGGDGIEIPLVDATAATLKIKKPYPDVSTHKAAGDAIDLLDAAIQKVSSYRSNFGSYENALTHAKTNAENMSENTQAAESRIRDTDIPSEMLLYSKYQILSQAGQSILAQANQTKTAVLELLQ